MGIELNGGSFYMTYSDDYLIKLGENIDMSMEYEEEAMPILNGLNKSASFICEASSMDLDLLNDMSPLMPLNKFTLQYYINIMIRIEDIQKRLREAIELGVLSQKEIAEKLGINPSTVSKYMRLDKYPSLDTFANLCQILDVSADEILGLK